MFGATLRMRSATNRRTSSRNGVHAPAAPVSIQLKLVTSWSLHESKANAEVTMRGTAQRGPGSSRWTRALITGASSGIGEAIARRLAADHVELVLVARRRERLREVGQELERVSGRPVEVVAADLTEDADVLRVEARLSSSERPVDLLVNNAGGGQLSLFPGGTPEEEARSIRLNATA